MLLQMNKPGNALGAYEAALQKHPNRFNALYGAALAAEKSGNVQKATTYFQQLVAVVGHTQSERPEMNVARRFLKEPIIQYKNLGAMGDYQHGIVNIMAEVRPWDNRINCLLWNSH